MTFYRAIIPVAALMSLAACTKNFDTINTNPNAPQTTNPEFLMSQVLTTTAYDYQKDAYYNEPASAGRYITLIQNEGADLFQWSAESWDGPYSKLSVNKTFSDLAAVQGDDQYVAVATIMRVFNFSYVTDLYGDIPYSQALKSKDEQIVHPAYDQQKDIYPDLVQQLKDVNVALTKVTRAIDPSADVVFGGNVLQWRRFANALRLRLLLRMSKQYAGAFSDIQEMINDPATYPLMQSNDDNAEVKYLGNTPGDSWAGGPLSSKYVEFDKRRPSKEVVDFLLQRNDPRLQVWVAPVAEKEGALVDTNTYVGVPNAVATPTGYNGGPSHSSQLAPKFNANADPAVRASMMIYPEQCFILAEALQAGKITVSGETAESMYYKGIDAAMTYWGVQTQATDKGYYDQAKVKYNGTLEQLIGQKWIALFLKGAEGWFDERRTGFPVFVLGPVAAQKTIPKRYMYPLAEVNYNDDEYKKALTIFGPDNINTLMWYLK